MRGNGQPIAAGAISAIVGFASSFAIVLAGLRGAGATAGQAAAGLCALCLGMGACGIALSLRHRLPLVVAWSTPGAALMISAGPFDGGYRAALGAFLVCGALIVLAGMWRTLGRWLAMIPGPIASAMLAGVLLPICLAPVRAVAELPLEAGPVVLVWAVLSCFARRWAVTGAIVATGISVALSQDLGVLESARLWPSVDVALPVLNAGTLISLALPLFVVTMAGQNIPGFAVLTTFGYRPPVRSTLVATGATSMALAPFGGHGVNLAAITAALAAGPEGHPDPARRWIAAVSANGSYMLFALGAGLAGAMIVAAPPLLIEAAAGLALLGAFAGLIGGMDAEGYREPAVVTFLVSGSGVTVLSISAPFWGLVSGLALLALQRAAARARPAAGGAEPPAAPARPPER